MVNAYDLESVKILLKDIQKMFAIEINEYNKIIDRTNMDEEVAEKARPSQHKKIK